MSSAHKPIVEALLALDSGSDSERSSPPHSIPAPTAQAVLAVQLHAGAVSGLLITVQNGICCLKNKNPTKNPKQYSRIHCAGQIRPMLVVFPSATGRLPFWEGALAAHHSSDRPYCAQ